MRSLVLVPWILACGSSRPPAAPPPAPRAPAAPSSGPALPWATPEGFRAETIPFPLDFAPGISHKGREELRFAPGFFDPAAPGYWSYTFVWRTEDPAELAADAVGGELTAYFRGLIGAVDRGRRIADPGAIVVRATPAGARFALVAHVFDAFKTGQPLDLVGWAERGACGTGALWRFVLAPGSSTLRSALEELAARAACDQPVPPPAPPR